MKKKLDKETKARLGILWVLLNISTETESLNETISIMDEIERMDRSAKKMWDKQFRITSHGKTIFEWNPNQRKAYVGGGQ